MYSCGTYLQTSAVVTESVLERTWIIRKHRQLSPGVHLKTDEKWCFV